MFGEAAAALLKLAGHSGNVPGAFMAEEVPGALAKLQAGLKTASENDQQESANADADNSSSQDDDDTANKVALATRAVPLIELLEAAIKSNDNVQWDN